MASGLPVVLGHVGGIGDLVEDGVNGFLVPPRDPVALNAALECLLSSETLRRAMGAASRARALAMFDNRRIFERITAIGSAIARGEPLSRLPDADAPMHGPSQERVIRDASEARR